MAINSELLAVLLDGGIVMHLQPSELEAVASGLGEFDTSEEGNLITLAEAVQSLQPNERAPLWELAVRRYGRGKPLNQAAGEIGMDTIRARCLIEAFQRALLTVPAPD